MTSQMFDFVVLPRSVSVSRGLPKYFTGLPCAHGHVSARHTKSKICCGCTKRRNAEKHKKHGDAHNERRRVRYASSEAIKGALRQSSTRYYRENLDAAKAARRSYYEKNKQHLIAAQAEYARARSEVDHLYRMRTRLRTLVKSALKRRASKASKSTVVLLGASIQTALAHIEGLFLAGMSWENHGEWHIDHITPLASAKNEDELTRLCHYKNLQPLWAKDNLSKGKKMPIKNKESE